MNNIKPIQYILSALLLFTLLGGLFAYQYRVFFDRKLHVVFCDVGQGDAIFIRTPSGKDILVDGGPSNKVLDCLEKHMPFWDRSVELMILTHPHLDHYLGLIDVIERYTVKFFATEKLSNKTVSFREFISKVENEGTNLNYVHRGDSFKTSDGVRFEVLGPSKEFLLGTSPNGIVGESSEFGSLIIHVSFGSFDTLLTGDAQVRGLREAIEFFNYPIELFQVPHHGSKTGLRKDILSRIAPKIAVISVGKKNRYDHPAKEVLNTLKEEDVKILRTDELGTIEIVSNGKNWFIR